MSKPSNDAYAEGYARIFGKHKLTHKKNPVAKNDFNKASTHKDKKKEAKKTGDYNERDT